MKRGHTDVPDRQRSKTEAESRAKQKAFYKFLKNTIFSDHIKDDGSHRDEINKYRRVIHSLYKIRDEDTFGTQAPEPGELWVNIGLMCHTLGVSNPPASFQASYTAYYNALNIGAAAGEADDEPEGAPAPLAGAGGGAAEGGAHVLLPLLLVPGDASSSDSSDSEEEGPFLGWH